jgi:hypothetical protein
MIASFMYPAGKLLLLRGGVNFETDKLSAVLVDGRYVPELHHRVYDDLIGEVRGRGYWAGGLSLKGARLVEDGGRVILHADPLVIERTTLAAVAVVMVHESTKTLMAYCAGEARSVRDADLTIGWEDGLLVF